MLPNETSIPREAWSVLIVSTLAFTVCFMAWMMFGVIAILLNNKLGLNATEFGLLTAMPVLTGPLIRVPLGIWTDRYGGRIVMTMLMAATVPAIWLMSYATAVNGTNTFHAGLRVYTFIALMFVLGIAFGFGKASAFKYIGNELPHQHRHRQRNRRSGWWHGRVRAADHLRRAHGSHRRQVQRLHAALRGLGLADLDVLDRGPRNRNDGSERSASPLSRSVAR